jgi:hypothetical protein
MKWRRIREPGVVEKRAQRWVQPRFDHQGSELPGCLVRGHRFLPVCAAVKGDDPCVIRIEAARY